MTYRNVPTWFALILLLGGLSACDTADDSTGMDTDGDHDPAGEEDGDLDGEDGDLDGDEDDEPPVMTSSLALSASGTIILTDDTTGIHAAWLPTVRCDGVDYVSSGCTSARKAEGFSCLIDSVGTVSVELTETELGLSFTAQSPCSLESIGLDGGAEVPGAKAWLSNGFQSWSQSGVLALAEDVGEDELADALADRGDSEVVRDGRALSFWHGFVASDEAALFTGVLTTERWRSWMRYVKDDQLEEPFGVHVVMQSGGMGEHISVEAGETVAGERWFIASGPKVHAVMAEYGKALPSRRKTVEAVADAGWNSWYELWDSVDETAVRENAALVKPMLQNVLGTETPLRITVDDGWQQAWGEWLPNDKFPSGLDGLAEDLSADGFEMGVWLAPLLVSENSSLVTDHPDWFVQGTTWSHLVNGKMYILDVTHPDAATHLREAVARIAGWGYGLLKIDFLFAGTFEGGRYEDVTPMQAYHRALSIIREGVGEDVILVAVGAPGQASFPHVDAWRLGGDIAVDPIGPAWPFAANEARSIAARWSLCYATLCDADPPILRELEQHEVDTGAWIVALSGGALFLSDDLRNLPEERRGWGLTEDIARLSIGGLPAAPLDLIPATPPESLVSALTDTLLSENNQVVPWIWQLPDGRTLLLNTSDEEQEYQGTSVSARSTALVNP